MKTGIELIAEERQEQITKHCRSIKRDVEVNSNGDLASAAIGAILARPSEFPHWSRLSIDKIVSKPYKDRLIIAGALIAAEIDRLNSQENK